MLEPTVSYDEKVITKKGERETMKLRAEYISDKKLDGVTNKSKAGLTNISPGVEGVHKLKVVVKEARLANRELLLGDEKYGQSDARRYYERWRFLKSIGVPVVSSMRVVSDNNVLMGDMLADGSEFIGKETYWYDENHKRPLSAVEEKFLGIDPALIKDEVDRIFFLAWRNGVILPNDNEEFTVLVHPNGSWKVMVKDLDWLLPTSAVNGDYYEIKKAELSRRVDKIVEMLIARKEASSHGG